MMNTTTTIDKATNNQNAFNYAVYMMLGSYFKQMEAVSDLAGAGAGIVLCEGRQELCCLPGSPLHIGCAKRLPWSTHEAAVSAV